MVRVIIHGQILCSFVRGTCTATQERLTSGSFLLVRSIGQLLLETNREAWMNFGPWVRQLRRERGLDLQTLAERTGVDTSTISRIENERTQTTLYTAIRICEGLEVTPADVTRALQGKPPVSVGEPHEAYVTDRPMLTVEDVKACVETFQADPQKGRSLLANLVTRSFGMLDRRGATGAEVQQLVLEPLQKFQAGAHVHECELPYPPDIEAETILSIYRSGGVLLLKDVGAYIGKVRRKKRMTLAGLEESVQISDSVLSRLEAGSVERVKLTDVLTLDGQLAQDSEILGMYWSACQFRARFLRRQTRRNGPAASSVGWTEEEFKLASFLITISRWWEHLNWGDASWITGLRRAFGVVAS
jgi:transcriptional regulator with XRE-family HTH domain